MFLQRLLLSRSSMRFTPSSWPHMHTGAHAFLLFIFDGKLTFLSTRINYSFRVRHLSIFIHFNWIFLIEARIHTLQNKCMSDAGESDRWTPLAIRLLFYLHTAHCALRCSQENNYYFIKWIHLKFLRFIDVKQNSQNRLSWPTFVVSADCECMRDSTE